VSPAFRVEPVALVPVDRLVAERGSNPENIFLAWADAPDLTEAVLGMATALRRRTALPKVSRELAVVTVGLETDASLEVEHHRNAALAAGIRPEQLQRLREFETADCFTEQERAAIPYAKEATGTAGCPMPSGRSSVFSGIDNVSSCS
jgi:alkylhydroperoxidase family enzyme